MITDIIKQNRLMLRCLVIFMPFFITTNSCNKAVEADAPLTSVSEVNIYKSDAAAISVLTGIYQHMNTTIFTGTSSISLLAGLSSDEFTLSPNVSSTDAKSYHYIDSLFSDHNGSVGTQYWSQLYNYIFKCNAAIEGLTASSSLTSSVKYQLLGEAKFLRAFFYFYLVNFYGDVPLATTTNWSVNAKIERTSITEVYGQIINDLKEAKELLYDGYLDGNLQTYALGKEERVRPSKWAAIALLARVYLYVGDWINAEAQSTLIIGNPLYSLANIKDVFLKNSTESIWQLQPIGSGQNTSDAVLFLLPTSGPSATFPVSLSPQMLNSFETKDLRRYGRNWIDSVKVGAVNYYFPYKYKAGKNVNITSVTNLTEYLMVLRLAEQFLIRAEARARQNNLTDAKVDLNAIRNRAGLGITSASDQNTLLSAIMHERQDEFFSEWGHRWFDLKRTGMIDAVMSVVRPLKANGASWKSYMQLYPVLFSDIQRNPLLSQNLNY